MSELKPCPFCGGEAGFFTYYDDNGAHYAVICDTDGYRGSAYYARAGEEIKEKAIEDWNKRINNGGQNDLNNTNIKRNHMERYR